MSRTPRLDKVLRAVNAVLVRTGTHRIYQLPNGKRIAVSKTPSDRYAENNAIADVRRALRQP